MSLAAYKVVLPFKGTQPGDITVERKTIVVASFDPADGSDPKARVDVTTVKKPRQEGQIPRDFLQALPEATSSHYLEEYLATLSDSEETPPSVSSSSASGMPSASQTPLATPASPSVSAAAASVHLFVESSVDGAPTLKPTVAFLDGGGKLNLIPVVGVYKHLPGPSLQRKARPEDPDIIDPYHVLGAGAFGISFKMGDTRKGEDDVALKATAAPRTQLERTMISNESYIPAAVRHPNVLPAAGPPMEEQVRYPPLPRHSDLHTVPRKCHAMHYITSRADLTCGDLDRVIRRHLRSPSADPAADRTERWWLLVDMVRGLAYLHGKPFEHNDRRVLHNDIKPANVLLRRDPATGRLMALLADLGMACEYTGGSANFGLALIRGTPGFMAPELYVESAQLAAAGLRPGNTPATDVYSMGVTLFCLYTQTDTYHKTEERPSEDELREAFAEVGVMEAAAGCPPVLVDLLVRMCSRDPTARPVMKRVREAVEAVVVAPEEARRKAAAEEEARRKAAAEEEARRKAAAEEEARRKAAAEEEARRKAAAEEEARRKAAAEEEARRKAAAEEEARRKAAAEEEVRRKAEEEARRKAAEPAEARRKAAEAAEARRKGAAEEKVRREAADEEEARRKAAEAAKARRKAAEAAKARHKAAEAAKARRKAAAEEEARREAAEAAEAAEARRKAAEARRKAANEAAEARRKAAEAAEARRKAAAEEEARRKAAAEEEARRKAAAEEEARRKAADEAAEARRKAAEAAEARRKAADEEEARRKAAEAAEARRKAAEAAEARRKAAEAAEARRKAAAEEEARRKTADEEEGRRKTADEEEARRKAADEEEARRKAAEAAEARRKAAAEVEARRKAETAAHSRPATTTYSPATAKSSPATASPRPATATSSRPATATSSPTTAKSSRPATAAPSRSAIEGFVQQRTRPAISPTPPPSSQPPPSEIATPHPLIIPIPHQRHAPPPLATLLPHPSGHPSPAHQALQLRRQNPQPSPAHQSPQLRRQTVPHQQRLLDVPVFGISSSENLDNFLS
ncbi:putative vesicular transport-associated repeat protein [Paratrimastix pyriformis]|uniref:Vesicular transport-associated repeat protein n=1 Tax=Paratrimastix pyriformis TaxID=342808 RepID=A0ABQ8UHQ5_9EUKA|nr:putative vesicular transport-associated repeat protein [Paratrimastix pyriformis]